MKFFPVTALFSCMTPKVTACLASLALAVIVFSAPAAYAQTADGETPADEFFCDDNFDGRLRGLCNAFCEAMDCDSLDAQASANACMKMEEKIAPLLAEDNILHDPDLEITMANPFNPSGPTEGHCGVAAACDLFDQSYYCTVQGKVLADDALCIVDFDPERDPDQCVAGPEE
jgi:hypothetical protein